MPKHAVYTRFTTQPDKGPELIDVLLRANDIVSEAEGCRQYIINHDIDNKDLIWVTELWDNQEDYAISLTLDGCKELTTEATHFLALPPEQIELRAFAGKGVED